MMTNLEFGERVGCSESMASRLRSGDRLPGREQLGRIVAEFELNQEEAFAAYTAGRMAFGKYVTEKVFDAEDVPASL